LSFVACPVVQNSSKLSPLSQSRYDCGENVIEHKMFFDVVYIFFLKNFSF